MYFDLAGQLLLLVLDVLALNRIKDLVTTDSNAILSRSGVHISRLLVQSISFISGGFGSIRSHLDVDDT